MDKIIPHIHTCEVKLCRPGTWKEFCPLRGELSETEDECERCQHFVIVDFKPDNDLMIDKVTHVNPAPSALVETA
jgi:hypothetical protein